MNISTIPQLNSDNFNNWKFRVGALLAEKQLEDTLEKVVTDFREDKEISEFKLRDAKAKSIIVQCVSDKHLDIIKDAKTAKEMLEFLEGIFQRKSVFTKLTLKKRLLTLKHKRSDPLEDHFHLFDTLIRELEGVGSKVDEEDKVCHLLLTLNEEYQAVITAIETMNTTVTMDFVKSRLLDEELKIKSKQGQTRSQNDASFNVFPHVCYKCGKPGHKIAECRSKHRGQFRGRRSVPRGQYNRQRGQFQSQNRSHGQDSGSQANEANEIAFIALNSTVMSWKGINRFILDSGCTQHMVMGEMESYMSNIEELESEVKIGTAKNNEVLYAKKKGTVKGICQGKEIKIEA